MYVSTGTAFDVTNAQMHKAQINANNKEDICKRARRIIPVRKEKKRKEDEKDKRNELKKRQRNKIRETNKTLICCVLLLYLIDDD